MRLTDYTDYTLRVLIYLNRTKSLTTLGELSKTLNISRNNLIKVSNKLAKLGYVEASRGRLGGLQIRKETGKVKVGEIVRHAEENLHLAECFAGGKSTCTLLRGCILKVCLYEALEAFLGSLDRYTLNDITGPSIEGRVPKSI